MSDETMRDLVNGIYTDRVRQMLEEPSFWRAQGLAHTAREFERRAAREQEIAEQKANPRPLTLDSLIEALGWTEEFAEHFVQPYCDCATTGYEFDWDECPHSPGGGRAV